MWEELLTEYDFGGHPGMKKYCIDVARDRYKDWKNYLKKKIWMKYKHDEEQLKAHLDSRVVDDQFKAMVEYWESEEGKAESEWLAKNRSKKVMDGVEPDPMDVFIKAYTPKDPAKDHETVKMLEEISALRQSQGSEGTSTMEPILTQVIGEGKGKYVRGYGKHHNKKDVATPEGRYMTHQMTRLVNENQELREKLDQNTTAFTYVQDLLASICGQLNMPVPPMPSMPANTPEERRSAANEGQGSGPGSSTGQ